MDPNMMKCMSKRLLLIISKLTKEQIMDDLNGVMSPLTAPDDERTSCTFG